MQSFGLPEVSVLIVFAVGVGVPIWFALKAKPLATLPYKWATWLAIQTTLVSLVGFLTALSVITKKGLNAGAALFLLLGFLSLFGALGLFWRMRAGVPFLIASEVFLVLLNPLVDTLYPSGKPTTQPGSGFVLLVIVVVNVFYFKKRWKSMVPGLFMRKNQAPTVQH